jgi:hypothetical protein
VTNGPLLTLTVAGEGPGSTVTVPEVGQVLSVRAEAASATPFDRLELLNNGEVVAQAAGSGSPVCEARLAIDWPAERGGWLAARCVGRTVVPDRPAGQRVFAHTSPVYLAVAGQPPAVDREAVAGLVKHVDRTRAWAEGEACCPTEKQRRKLAEVFEAAQQALEGRQGG